MKLMSQAAMDELVEEALVWCNADVSMIVVKAKHHGDIRFANNQVTSSTEHCDVELTVRSRFGKREGYASTNQFDQASLKKVAKQSEFIAKSSPINKEMIAWPRFLKVKPSTSAFASASDISDPELRADQLVKSMKLARNNTYSVSGFFAHNSEQIALRSSQGLQALHQQSEYQFSTTARDESKKASAWASDIGTDLASADFTRQTDQVLRQVAQAANPRSLSPGKYTVVLAPEALAPLMVYLMPALEARPAEQGRSYFAGSRGRTLAGKKLFDSRITVLSDPYHPLAGSAPWTEDGLPLTRNAFIHQGKLENLWYSPYWATRSKQKGPYKPSNLILGGYKQTMDDVISQTKRGLLVTRLWYVRPLDEKKLTFTGSTRDGVFMIENGKIRFPVNNLRFNMSLPDMFRQVAAIGEQKRVPGGIPMVLPTLKIRDFNFTSISSSI